MVAGISESDLGFGIFLRAPIFFIDIDENGEETGEEVETDGNPTFIAFMPVFVLSFTVCHASFPASISEFNMALLYLLGKQVLT
mmetsp:Transcript_53248/g.111052  ORF Transcript_53248/g.111052 Transcript_53248/m.111052 type:complete len:84 (-) Transcript_53248:109-360(-)